MTSDAREIYSRELAKRLADDEGTRLLRLLQMTDFLVHPATPQRPTPNAGTRPHPISIWCPQKENDSLVFIRPQPGPFGDHYADMERICNTKPDGTKRVLWFGESAAAGYLFAPEYTPAKVLQSMLEGMAPATTWDVIDLARTNEHLDSLKATVEAAMQLSPDLLAIYTGNNWNLLETPGHSPYAHDFKARQDYAARLREGGFQAAIEDAGLTLSAKVNRTLEAIAQIASENQIPLVLIVPEVNLADWESRQPLIWLSETKLAEWYQTKERADTALAHDDWVGAKEHAFSMLKLDNGTCSSTYQILAKAYQGLGDIAKAREAAQAGVDSTYHATLCFIDAPRATSLAQNILRRFGERDHIHLVDMPALFHQEDGLPGREWFLDYCHLTAEGIQKTMVETATKLLQALGVSATGKPPQCAPSPRIEATALLGAAIHGAHRLLSSEKREILCHYLLKALEIDPEIESAMMDLVAARSGPLPAVLHAVQQRNATSPFRLTPQHGWKYNYLDVEVILAIREALTKQNPVRAAEINRMLQNERGVTDEWQELLPYNLWEPVEQVYTDLLETTDLPLRAFFRAPLPETSLCLIADSGRDLEVSVVTRLPDPAGINQRFGRVALLLNGNPLAEYLAGSAWERVVIPIAAGRIEPVVNKLTFCWPFPQTPGDTALTQVMHELEKGREAAAHPIFGEIFSVKVRVLT